MAALLEESLLEVAPHGRGEIPSPPRDGLADALYGNSGQPFSHAAAASSSSTGDAIKSAMPELVKGAGFARKGGNAPLHDHRDIALRAHQATLDLRNEVWRGYHDKAGVVKSGFRGDFLGQFGALRTALMTPSIGEQLAQIVTAIGNPDLTRSFTAGNLGIGSVYGFVPFDLLAPSRLIYPVYTVYRNKFPRPAGQGASRIERLVVGISGSQTGGQGVLDISLPELVQSGGSFGSWPLNLPPAGSQTTTTLNVPYRFMGVTEELSWLAQFAGQGYEDISALANLIMLQEMMLGEEYSLICGSSANLATPATPTITARTAGSNETTNGANGTFNVKVSATNWFGETAVSSAATGSTLAGQVTDVTIVPSVGAMNYNIYVSTGGTYYLMATGVGGVKFTLQGTPPASGTAAPSTDSGTGKSTRIEGVIPTLTGQSANAGVYPTSPVMWQGGYVNQAVGTHLSYSAIYTALENLWQQTTNNPGAFKADPAELISSGIDIANLSTDVISQGQGTNYELFISQQQVGDVTVGAAVSQFQNPLTKSLLKLVVHPWYTQGNCELLSYQLPQTWTNVANAWEMTMVQDYVSISLN